MADAWDDGSDDDWENDDEEDDFNARLNSLNVTNKQFEDEEDLAVKEKTVFAKQEHETFKKKGNALSAKKKAEQERLEAEEIARKTIALETEMESNMTADEQRAYRKKQMQETENALADDLFGDIDDEPKKMEVVNDKLVLNDVKDHLKHAQKVSAALKHHGNIHFAAAFLKEVIQKSRDVLDDSAISEIIKTCNVIKNEKVQASKRKVKYQAQKSSKRDKAGEAKARKLQTDLYGDNDDYDDVDAYGADFEEGFF